MNRRQPRKGSFRNKMFKEAIKNTEALKNWVIRDWTNKLCFNGKSFESFDAAEYWLAIKLGDNYETDRQEYYITEEKINE